MEIHCPRVKISKLKLGVCESCDEAWRLWVKSGKLFKRGLKKDFKPLIRRADWLLIKAAKVLYTQHRKPLAEPIRYAPLLIQSGRVIEIHSFKCWNCDGPVYAGGSKNSEMLSCLSCNAILSTDWMLGKEGKDVAKRIHLGYYEGPNSKASWEEFRWSKKAKDIIRRTT